jgi:hypothetical protein
MYAPLNTSTAKLEGLPRVVTGREISRLKTKAARAMLAADIADGNATIVKPTLEQIAAACGVNEHYVGLVRRVRRQRPDLAHRLNTEPVYRVAAAAGYGWSWKPTLVSSWLSTPESKRVEAVKTIGTEKVWTALSSAVD